jgi:16S rRNA processing protein RimM
VSAPRPDGLLEVGHIGRAHGVRGDVYVHLTTDRTERVRPGSRLHARGEWLVVTSANEQPKGWIVHFEGIADRSAAERLTSSALFAEPLDDPDALWVHDLIGSRVVDTDGVDRGTCVAVVDNPAADLLELEDGTLVPVTFVVAAEPGVVRVDTPEGLFE